jgi:hypothetical protein
VRQPVHHTSAFCSRKILIVRSRKVWITGFADGNCFARTTGFIRIAEGQIQSRLLMESFAQFFLHASMVTVDACSHRKPELRRVLRLEGILAKQDIRVGLRV